MLKAAGFLVSSILSFSCGYREEKNLKASLAGGGLQGVIFEPKVWEGRSLALSQQKLLAVVQLGKAAPSYFEKYDLLLIQ